MQKLFFVIIILSIFLVGCQSKCPDCVCPTYQESECITTEEKALLTTDFFNYGVNEENYNEFYFDYYINNYGDSEAKDIKVKCILMDMDYNVLIIKTDDSGNLASRSSSSNRIITDGPTLDLKEKYIMYCYVDSCSNCDILHRRIPSLIDTFEDY